MDVTHPVHQGSAPPAQGGGFLLGAPSPQDIFTPEDFSAEHRLAARTLGAFLEAEVEPRTAELETHNYALMRGLLRRLGGLGFLGVDIPEAYGGTGLDFITSLLVGETMSRGSFAVAYGAHAVIGTLPIVYFGTDDQKRRYLPGLAAGEIIGAYALTEPTAGSDALAAKTRAVLAPGGRAYRLTGTKQFITNAGFADLFTTYAKVDGERFTGFLVERGTGGLDVGPEEHKMGIKGSSTASLFFDQAPVPVENVLGEVGGGHRVALNILNMGRLKLAAACIGAAKRALRQALAYASERQQFGRAIASFGLVQEKLAEMAVRVYVLESMIYRTGGLIQAARETGGGAAPAVAAVEEYAVECAIDKVYGSEAAGLVVDEMVQIYGGYGFIEDYPAARAYRDARISRIYEGTNEINRLLIAGMLLRRARRGRLPLVAALQAAVRSPDRFDGEIDAGDGAGGRALEDAPGSDGLRGLRAQVERAKHAALVVAGHALTTYGETLGEQQEVFARIADLVIEVFAMESGVLRALRAAAGGRPAEAKADLARAAVDTGLARMEGASREVLAAAGDGDRGGGLRARLGAVRRLLDDTAADPIRLRRRIAGRLLDAGAYVT
ncbi:MAG TPA: acyl-CoA dehydrogenase family protein [bacterium]|nr:acyl-CoA dehydrogenase family protein [bacterium]